MPIHDQGYRRYAGTRAAGRGWAVIAESGIKSVIAKRVFIGMLLVAWIQFFYMAVRMYFASNFAQMATFVGVKAETFREFLNFQAIFVFFIAIYVGAGLIANDRRANALQVYLSKPLTRAEYVAGKLAILFLFLTAVTWVPAVLLLLVQIMFAGSFTFVRDNIFLIPAITLFSLIQVLLASMTMLALSSMSKSSRFVGIMYAGLVFFTSALFNTVRGITGRGSLAWLSPKAVLEQVGDAIFRLPPRHDLSVSVALLVIVVLIGLSAYILERRVRGVEVVQ